MTSTATSPRAASPAASFSAQLAAFMRAEKVVESGNYTDTTNGTGGATGAYQIETSNWPTWLTEATHNPALAQKYPYAAAAPPALQDKVAAYEMTQLYNTFGDWAAVAGAWYAGPVNASNNGYVPPNNSLTVGQYVARVANAGGIPGYVGGASSSSPIASTTSGGANACLVKIPAIDLKITSIGPYCLFSQSSARAVFGALALGAGGLILLVTFAGVAVVGFRSAAPNLTKLAEAGGVLKLARRTPAPKPTPAGSGLSDQDIDDIAAEISYRQQQEEGDLGPRGGSTPARRRRAREAGFYGSTESM